MKDVFEPLMNNSDRALPSGFWEWMLFLFIAGSSTLSFMEGLSRIVVLYGLLVSFLFLLFFLYHRLNIQPEAFMYCIWVMWSVGGLSNVVNSSYYFQGLITVIQIAFMILLIAGLSALLRNMSITMSAIILGGMVSAGTAFYTGDIHRLMAGAATRLEGVTQNANSFAYQMLFVIFAVFFFWRRYSSRWVRVMFLAVLFVASMSIVYSGSRKGILSILIFVFMWWIYCQRKKLPKHPLMIYLALLLLLAGIYFSVDFVLSKTYLGKRFGENDVARGSNARLSLYMESLEVISKYPVFGVGINNFKTFSSSGLYSHSDYMEVATSTGIVGFILYFSTYIILWRRLNRIKAMTNDDHLLYRIGVIKAAIITILCIAAGRVNLSSKMTWIYLACAIGYSWSLESLLKRNLLNYKDHMEKMNMMIHNSSIISESNGIEKR